MQYNADVLAVTLSRKTAATLAREQGHLEIADYLDQQIAQKHVTPEQLLGLNGMDVLLAAIEHKEDN